METALRHYSVLSEGVTILVEHEGDAHYLDVEEVRARGSPALREADREHRNHEAGEDKFPEGDDGVPGNERRVSLVSLLGDLDLEVEFRSGSPRVSEPREGPDSADSAENPIQDDEDIGTPRLSSPRSRTHSRTEVAGDRLGHGDSAMKTERLPLPLPAKATKDGSVISGPRRSLGIERRPSSINRRKSIPGPSIPFIGRSSPGSRLKTFPGKGRALGTLRGEKTEEGTDYSTILVQRKGTTLSPSTIREREETRNTRKASSGRDWRRIWEMPLKTRISFSLPERGIVLGEGPKLAETTCAALQSQQRDAEVQSIMVACGTCRRGIPETNYRLHQLRCSGAPISIPCRASRSLNRSSISQTGKSTGEPVRVVETTGDPRKEAGGAEDEARDLARLRGRSGGESGSPGEGIGSAPGCSRSSTEPPRVQGSTTSQEEDNPGREEEEQEQNGTCIRPVGGGRDATPRPKQRTAPMTSCKFCGLSFRDASATSAHENICGARTDLCDRCCSLVPRREAQLHRQPGGECDVNIAKASALEDAVTVAGNAGVVDATSTGGATGSAVHRGVVQGSWSIDAGGDSATGRGQPNSLRFGSGLVDRLLAEAARTSRQASIALRSVREENDRLLAMGATESRSCGSSSLKSEIDQNVGSGSVRPVHSGESNTQCKREVDKGPSAKDSCSPASERTVAELKDGITIPLVPQSPVRASVSRERKVSASVTLPEAASKSRTLRCRLGSGQGTTPFLGGHCRRDSGKIAATISTLIRGKSSTPGVSNPPPDHSPICRHSRSTSGVSPRLRAFSLPSVLERQHNGRDLDRVGSRTFRQVFTIASTSGAEHSGRGESMSARSVSSDSSFSSPRIGLDGARRICPSVGERTVAVGRSGTNEGKRLLSCHGVGATVPEICKGPHPSRTMNRMFNAGSRSENYTRPALLRNSTVIAASQASIPGSLPSAALPTQASRGGTAARRKHGSGINPHGNATCNLPVKGLRGIQVGSDTLASRNREGRSGMISISKKTRVQARGLLIRADIGEGYMPAGTGRRRTFTDKDSTEPRTLVNGLRLVPLAPG